MKRVHLFEFEDQKWFPDIFRNYGTDYLRLLTVRTKMFHPVIPILRKGIEATRNKQIIDLCSGSGGAIIDLYKSLKEDYPELKIVFTDFFPNLKSKNEIESSLNEATYKVSSVDARSISDELQGFRTMFLSFHHFNKKDAKKILQNVVDSGETIAIFEGQDRSIKSIFAMVISPISVLIATPFISPFSFGRLFYTYCIPVVPIFVMWDGIVSSLRTYSIKELKKLVASLDNHKSYEWEMNRIKSGPANIIYLLGTKK